MRRSRRKGRSTTRGEIGCVDGGFKGKTQKMVRGGQKGLGVGTWGMKHEAGPTGDGVAHEGERGPPLTRKLCGGVTEGQEPAYIGWIT